MRIIGRNGWRRALDVCLVAVCAGFVVLFCAVALLGEPRPDLPFFDVDRGRVCVIAHRGGAGLWPENTLFAFGRALKLGVDVLEMDVRGTRDGVPVVIHDETVDRTTNGFGRVGEMNLAQLKTLDAGFNWTADGRRGFPYRGKGITIPTLDEVFAAFPHARFNIELKTGSPSLTPALARLIVRHNSAERVLVYSRDATAIREFRRLCRGCATATSDREIRLFVLAKRLRLSVAYLAPAEALQVPEMAGDMRLVDQRFVDTAHKRNIAVHVWTVNDPDSMRRLVGMGVDGLITDYPDRMLALLGR